MPPTSTMMPILPQIQIGAHHVLMPHGVVGGDWLTAVPLEGGDVALVVGDVVGRAGEAQVAMTHLSAVAQHLLEQGLGPEALLTQLDHATRRHPHARGATAVASVISPGTGHVVCAQRGHLPPVVVPCAGSAHALDVPPSSPLGMPGTAALTEVDLSDGDLLALYTDGLVERTQVGIGEGVDRLTRTADAVTGTNLAHGTCPEVGAITSEIVRRLTTGPEGAADDEALLLLARYRREPPTDLRIPFVAVPSALAQVRSRVNAWLEQLGAADHDRFALVQAISEAVGNLVHLQSFGDGRTIRLDLAAGLGPDGRVLVTITDDNDWSDLLERRESDPPMGLTADPAARLPMSDRNRALVLMLDLVDEMTVERLLVGTRVTLDKALAHETVRTSTAELAPPGAGSLDVHAQVSDGERGLAVRGPVVFDTVETLRLAVLASHGNDGAPLLLDLAEVTLLSGVGVRLLHDLTRAGLVRVRAPEGSPAHATLELTAVPHETVAMHDLG